MTDTSELMKDQKLTANVSYALMTVDTYYHTSLIYSASPGSVRNLRAATVTDTSVTVTWTRPVVTGRSDFYYTLQYSDPDNIGAFLPVPPQRIDNQALSVRYTIPELQPNTPYTIRVTSHNGVSDQDTENAALREVDIQVRTMEGGKVATCRSACLLFMSACHVNAAPSVPQDVRAFSGVVVWGPPAQTNGVITRYEVRFSGTISGSRTVSKGPSENYHAVTGDNILNLVGTIHVQVNATCSQ